MPRTAGRRHEDTRRLLLDAAAAVVRERGLGATLDDIARGAGVSKGGLLYHFATKDDLLLALAGDLLESFREAVHAAVDPADTRSGRLTRGYVRASFQAPDAEAARAEMSLIAQLLTRPDVAALAHADAERWRTDLADDGLPAGVRTLVIAAADGAAASTFWGDTHNSPHLDDLRTHLLDLTEVSAEA